MVSPLPFAASHRPCKTNGTTNRAAPSLGPSCGNAHQPRLRAPMVMLLALCVLLPVAHGLELLQASESDLWSVVIDAGSTGSRVAIYKFVAPKGFTNVTQVDLDLYAGIKVTPGLSAYAGKPEEAAASIQPLLDLALTTIPAAEQAYTPIQLGATAGLRFLGEAQSEEILASARAAIRAKTPFQFRDADVRIISGEEEGAYGWAQANYLLDRLGLPTEDTLAVIDMGGGSMQETFAMTAEEADMRPANVTDVLLVNGNVTLPNYRIYTHSYLGVGSKAARAALLAQGGADGNSRASPCIPLGVNETYTYNGTTYQVSPLAGGPNTAACAAAALKAIKTYEPCGANDQAECSFWGVWAGTRTAPADVILMSSFWWTALEGGLIPANSTEVELTPRDYGTVASNACSTPLAQYPKAFPELDEAGYPYLCMDATFIHTVLTEGFSFSEDQVMQVIDVVNYDKPTGSVDEAQEVSMSWTMGAALTTLMGWEAEVAGGQQPAAEPPTAEAPAAAPPGQLAAPLPSAADALILGFPLMLLLALTGALATL